jgi:hypothetical protein
MMSEKKKSETSRLEAFKVSFQMLSLIFFSHHSQRHFNSRVELWFIFNMLWNFFENSNYELKSWIFCYFFLFLSFFIVNWIVNCMLRLHQSLNSPRNLIRKLCVVSERDQKLNSHHHHHLHLHRLFFFQQTMHYWSNFCSHPTRNFFQCSSSTWLLLHMASYTTIAFTSSSIVIVFVLLYKWCSTSSSLCVVCRVKNSHFARHETSFNYNFYFRETREHKV